jgi:hypothetical protein
VNKVKNYANSLSRGSLYIFIYLFYAGIYLNAHTVRRVTVKRSAGEKIESKFVSAAFFCRDQKPSALIVYSAESSRAIIHGRAYLQMHTQMLMKAHHLRSSFST